MATGVYPRKDVDERFWSKVKLEDEIFPENGCMVWAAKNKTRDGYGQFHVSKRAFLAHKWAYERTYGPVPEGLQLDHLCRVRLCVNPDHLEAVTAKINITRGETKSSSEMRRNAQTGRYA